MSASDTFDTFENEALFTIAALDADDDARALLPETESWLALIDAGRDGDRNFRARDMKAAARRSVSNARLDQSCIDFGRDLLYDVRDRQSPIFIGYFPVSPSRFIKLALDQQVTRVKGWLNTQHPVLETHRAAITTATENVDQALREAASVAPARGENWAARTKLADDLTRLRDGLHRALSEIAEQKKLARDWADAFFRVGDGSDGAPPAPNPG